jgi:hypothetical protein
MSGLFSLLKDIALGSSLESNTKYYHDNSVFNRNTTTCGDNVTAGSSLLLKETYICGDTYLALNALEKDPKPPNLFVSGDTFVGKNLTVTNTSIFNNLITANRNVVINGNLQLANCGDVATRINRADTLPSSDLNLKENISPIKNALDKVKQLNGVEFDFKSKDDCGYLNQHQIGLIAQEVKEVIPEVVATKENGNLGVSYQHLTALLIEAIKDQQKQIDDLTEQLEKINERIN